MEYTSDAPGAPAAVGPYSQATSNGSLVFLSGQIGINPETGEMAPDFESQTRQALSNLKAVLAYHNLNFSNVLKTTVYLTDMADYKPFNAIYEDALGDAKPARAAFQVAGLPLGAVVELEMIATKE